MSDSPFVTIAIPCLNEEAFIERCLRSVQAQDYPGHRLEILVADGGSRDATKSILAWFAEADRRIRVIDNPRRIQAAGLNAILRVARGELIVRMDAHCDYKADYVRRCVETLERTGADNVGGAPRAASRTLFQNALCAALKSPLGVGGASHWSADAEGFVDTVFLGAFRRRVFETVGLYDDHAVTNEDAELNQRLLAAGGKIYLSREIVVSYYPRSSFPALARQYFRYGAGRARTLLKHRMLPSSRPALPFVALLAGTLFLAVPTLHPLGLLLFGIYTFGAAIEALRVSLPAGLATAPIVWTIFPVIHVSHGLGFALGLARHHEWAPPEVLSPISSCRSDTCSDMDMASPTFQGASEPSFSVELCDSWAELEELNGSWDRLLDQSPSANSFVTREWLGAWWTAFGLGHSLVALLFREPSGDLGGILPMYADTIEGLSGIRLKRLRLVGDGSSDSDNLDFVLRSGSEPSGVRSLLSWLDANRDWDVCEFNTVPGGSPALPWLLQELKARGWVHDLEARPQRIVLLPTSWKEYLAQLSRNERWRIVSHTRRLEAKYDVRVRRSTEETLDADLDTLFRLHQKRWVERGQPGTFVSDARRAFYAEMARRFLSRRWLEFWLMELEGKPVAAQFGFRYRQTLYSLQEGFDPDYREDRIGAVLRARVLRELIAEGVRRYDFLAGNDVGKERWGPEVWRYWDVRFARRRSRGGVYLAARRTARLTKEWLRTHLPHPLFTAARGTYRLFLEPRRHQSD